MSCKKITMVSLLAAVAGCSSAPDAMLGTYCDYTAVMEFDGHGNLAVLTDEGQEAQGRYEYDPETDAVTISIGGGTIAATRTASGTLQSPQGSMESCDTNIEMAKEKIAESAVMRKREAVPAAKRQAVAEAEAKKPDFVAKALAPMFAKTTKKDILGLRLGMTPNEVTRLLKGKGFERGRLTDQSMRYGDLKIRHVQNGVFGRGSLSEGMRDMIVTYFTIGNRPRLHAVFRKTSYYSDDEVPFARMIQTIEDKYGAPARSVSAGYKGDETHLYWTADSNLDCEERTRGFFSLENARGGGLMDNGCFQGLMIKLHHDRDEDQRAVGMVESYLVDTSLAQTGETLVTRRAEAIRKREREEGLANATSAEL